MNIADYYRLVALIYFFFLMNHLTSQFTGIFLCLILHGRPPDI